MSLQVGNNFSGVNDLFTRDQENLGGGTYTLSGVTNKFVISFCDVTSSLVSEWINRLQELKTSVSGYVDVEIVGVLYENGGSPSNTEVADAIDNSSYGTGSLSFHLLRDITWGSSSAFHYHSALTSTGFADPFFYIIGPNYTVTDKFYYGSPHNGHGTLGAGITDNDFINFDWASVSHTAIGTDDSQLIKIKDFCLQRINDLRDASPSVSVSPVGGDCYSLPSIELTYSRKAFQSHSTSHYSLSNGVSVTSVSPSGQINLSDYYANNGEIRTLNLSEISSDLSTTLEFVEEPIVTNQITDTKDVNFTGLSVTYNVNVSTPRILSIVKNPHAG